MVEKTSKKLTCSNKLYITLGGRITLIKAVLANILVYYMFDFKMPCKVIKEIKSINRISYGEEVGRKKDHLVEWKDVVKPKEKGGWVWGG